MNRESEFFKGMIKYALLAAALVAVAAVLAVIPRREEKRDNWMVEVRIIEKVISEMDGEQVYLIRTEDKEGREAIYEINKSALNERLEVESVYQEIKEDKYHKFKMADRDEYDSHYPVICGAVSLIEGFSQ